MKKKVLLLLAVTACLPLTSCKSISNAEALKLLTAAKNSFSYANHYTISYEETTGNNVFVKGDYYIPSYYNQKNGLTNMQLLLTIKKPLTDDMKYIYQYSELEVSKREVNLVSKVETLSKTTGVIEDVTSLIDTSFSLDLIDLSFVSTYVSIPVKNGFSQTDKIEHVTSYSPTFSVNIKTTLLTNITVSFVTKYTDISKVKITNFTVKGKMASGNFLSVNYSLHDEPTETTWLDITKQYLPEEEDETPTE